MTVENTTRCHHHDGGEEWQRYGCQLERKKESELTDLKSAETYCYGGIMALRP